MDAVNIGDASFEGSSTDSLSISPASAFSVTGVKMIFSARLFFSASKNAENSV
jgi:hypothetical protein